MAQICVWKNAKKFDILPNKSPLLFPFSKLSNETHSPSPQTTYK